MNRDDAGTALVFWVLVLSAIASMTTLLVSRTANNAYETAIEQARLEAFYAAEGALAELRLHLSRDPDTRELQLAIGRCRCRVDVARDGDEWLATIEAWTDGSGDIAPVCSRLEARLSGPGIPWVREWRDLMPAPND